MSLSSLIVQREVASIRQVEEALARQVIYGGDLVTNLLEVAYIDERVVIRLLAESVGLMPAPAGMLRTPTEQARALVPAEMAAHREMVPLGIEEGKLVVAVAEPLTSEIEDELSFTLGMPLEQRIAPAVRVREALSRVYGLPLERRLQRLVDHLADKATRGVPVPLSVPPKVPIPPRPKSEPPKSSALLGAMSGNRERASTRERIATRVDFQPADDSSGAFATVDSDPRTAYAALEISSAPEPTILAEVPDPPIDPPVFPVRDTPVTPQAVTRASLRPSLLQREVVPPAKRAVRRRRGPLTLDMAKKELQSAQHRDALLDLFFDFGRQFFEYTAIFVVQGDIAEGRDAWGAGASRERVLGIGVPLDLPSVFATARELRRPVSTRPLTDGLDAVLLDDLQRPPQSTIVAVPVVVRTRVVALLLGDGGEATGEVPTSEVGAFATAVGYAFERLIMRRKLAGFGPGQSPTAVGRVSQGATQQLMAKAAPAVSDGGNGKIDGAHAADAFPTEPVETPAPETDLEASDDRSTSPSIFIREDGVSAPRVPSAPEIDATSLDDVSTRLLLDELARELGDDVEGTQVSEPEEFAPAQASVVIPPHLPPSSRTFTSEKELPTVIVDIARELGTLIERVLEHGTDDAAEAELLRQGATAMPVMMQRFPGPLASTGQSSRSGGPASADGEAGRASECGPLLRLVAAQRRVALPFVLTKIDSPDPETRYWATFLLTELAYPEALPSLVPRLCDQDTRTRRVARLALGAVIRSAPREVVLDVLSKSLALEATTRAVVVIEALADLREPATVPVLIHALSGGDAKVSAAARGALVVVTRQDLGADARAWTAWWSQHASRHRVEWLIESLSHELSEMRRAAGEELKGFARDSFGFSEDLPPRERERVQQRYREWWATEGRARLSRR